MTTTTQHASEDRNQTIAVIRQALRARSGKAWSVKGGRGTSWGWIEITSPPARRESFGYLSDADRAELGELLGVEVHHQGIQVPASMAHRREFIERAEGKPVTEIAQPYWD